MNSKEFVEKALHIAEEHNTAYVWGTFGLVAKSANMQRMINQYSKNTKYLDRAREIYGNGYFFDCVGLIKGILWGWVGNSTKIYGGAVYASNGVPDISADQMILKCADISAVFTHIEVGEAVWLPGHIGIYVGNGKVVEATPAWDGGVQITDISKNGFRSKNGGGTQYWKKHGKLPWLSYEATKMPKKKEEFTDIKGHYSEVHINKLTDYGVINGYDDGTFKPDNDITRAEVAKIVSDALENVCGYNLNLSYQFSDTDGHFAADAVAKLADCGIVNGFEDGRFRPDEKITRGQAAMIIANMLSYCGVSAKDAHDTFSDISGHYAEEHIKTLYAYGVINGYDDGTFRSDESVTRGQAAIMLANALSVLGK